MRQGRVIGEMKTCETTMDEVVSMITGAKEKQGQAGAQREKEITGTFIYDLSDHNTGRIDHGIIYCIAIFPFLEELQEYSESVSYLSGAVCGNDIRDLYG